MSAAVLEIDLRATGESTYDLPILDDETRAGKQDKSDPFGGNDGRNQARLVSGGPVQVYPPGFRNAYDVVLIDDGQLYTIDYGANSGWGGPPTGEGSDAQCSNQQSESGSTSFDSLHLISGRGYYGGHPKPTRANLSNIFNSANPQSPVSVANPIKCELRGAGAGKALTTFGFSTNGLVEYRASNFGGAMGVCGGTPSTDDDNDGFSNADELANGTDPCSPADLLADLDGDFLSDRIDTDDDGDDIADKDDPFPRDPNNGRTTALAVSYE